MVDSCADAQHLVPQALSLEEGQVRLLSPPRESVNVEQSVKGDIVWVRNVKINPTVHAENEYAKTTNRSDYITESSVLI